ncbi:hypothetical protein ACQ4PT_004713 [Festuca glaucescens]
MAGDGVGASGADGLELSLRLGTPTPAPAPRKNLTVVYDRRVLGAVDVVELQAIAIISTASRETAGKKIAGAYDDGGIAHLDRLGNKWTPTPASPDQGGILAPLPLLGDQAGLSMKRSLQRFLEKRKARTASPYGMHRPARPPRY